MKFAQRSGLKAEKVYAARIGGRTQPGSGSRWFARADVQTGQTLIQHKRTTAKQFILKLTDLETLEAQAAAVDRDPVFVIEFPGRRRYRVQRDYCRAEDAE